jgi:hypothetical protein
MTLFLYQDNLAIFPYRNPELLKQKKHTHDLGPSLAHLQFASKMNTDIEVAPLARVPQAF